METEKVDGQPEATETPLVQNAADRIIQLPLETMINIAKCGENNLNTLLCEWAIVHWVGVEDDKPADGSVGVYIGATSLIVTGFDDRDAAAEWLAAKYQEQENIEAILYQGRPKKFEIEVKAKISLR